MAFKLSLSTVEESKLNTNQDMSLLPRGFYAARMIECELRESKAGHPFFSMAFEVEADGWPTCPFIGRRVWSTLMLDHPNQTVVSIAHKTMADILVACGVPADQEIEDLERDFPTLTLDRPIYIHVNLRLNKQKGEYQAEPNGYFGRLEHEGKHRYGPGYQPVPDKTNSITANPELAGMAQHARDNLLKKLESLQVSQGGYSANPVLESKVGKQRSDTYGFEDVPF
jgi:hypothetical protein